MGETIKEVITETAKVQETESPVQVILDAVPESKKEEVKEALMIIRSEMYSGPIPPPEALHATKRFNQVQPTESSKWQRNSKSIEWHLKQKRSEGRSIKVREDNSSDSYWSLSA